jgi:hypothetical protein
VRVHTYVANYETVLYEYRFSTGHTLPAEFGPEPPRGPIKSRVDHPLPVHLVTISPHNLPDNLSSQSLTHEGAMISHIMLRDLLTQILSTKNP